MSIRIAVVAGTRPEAIKLIPVYEALKRRPELTPVFVSAGQHKQMLASVFEAFDFAPDISLDVMTENSALATLMGRLLTALQEVFAQERFDAVIVQGDTSTAFAAGLAGHYARIPVAHVEAGLRTHDKWAPFPEETHRRMIGALADYHFAATSQAVDALTAENVTRNVYTVGNTVVDALLLMRDRVRRSLNIYSERFGALTGGSRRYILLTAHRRENFGEGLENICEAVPRITDRHKDVSFIFCVHLNPNVKTIVHSRLRNVERIHLIEPQPYDSMVYLMMGAWLILTDSGGLQEEAPSLNVPILVMREKTERPEGVDAGCARLVGTDVDLILSEVERLWTSPDAYKAMQDVPNPYGDGMAAQRIAGHMVQALAAPRVEA